MKRGFFLFFPIMIALCSLLVMLLWNGVLAVVTDLPQIHFLQAAGIFCLSRLLFGRLPFGNFQRRRFYGPGAHRGKWMSMSSEDKERLKEEWKRRCVQPSDGM